MREQELGDPLGGLQRQAGESKEKAAGCVCVCVCLCVSVCVCVCDYTEREKPVNQGMNK